MRYDETLEALGSGLHVLAGAGLRAVVEAVCQDRNAQGDSLFERIDILVKQGLLTKPAAATLHSLREIGNTSVHEAVRYSFNQLYAGLAVIEHLLFGVYVLPDLANGLPPAKAGAGVAEHKAAVLAAAAVAVPPTDPNSINLA